MPSRFAYKPYQEGTTFTHRDYTRFTSSCKVCGEGIVEARLKWARLPKRIECHNCLARWWSHECRIRRLQPITNTRKRTK